MPPRLRLGHVHLVCGHLRIRIKMKLFLFIWVSLASTMGGEGENKENKARDGRINQNEGPGPGGPELWGSVWSGGTLGVSLPLLTGGIRDTDTSSDTGDRAAVAGSSQVCFPESWEERLLVRMKRAV